MKIYDDYECLLSTFQGSPPLVPRVLDVTKDKICYIVGTVFWDMPQKPNVLEDVAQDVLSLFL